LWGARGSDHEADEARYGGPQLRASEEARWAQHEARVVELRRRFVEGPVLILPARSGASSSPNGLTNIPDAGTIVTTYRVAADWGSLDAAQVHRSPDRSRIIVPATASIDGASLTGDGWTLTLGPGWVIRPAARAGDCAVVRER
jgi:hypothetical protein